MLVSAAVACFEGLRNEPNLGARLLIRFGWRRAGNPGCGRPRLRGGALHRLLRSLQGLEFFQGAVVVAVSRIDAALETLEHPVGEGKNAAVGMLVRLEAAFRTLGLVLPEFRFAAAEPAQQPLAVDQGIDERRRSGVAVEKRSWYAATRSSSCSGSSPGMTWA